MKISKIVLLLSMVMIFSLAVPYNGLFGSDVSHAYAAAGTVNYVSFSPKVADTCNNELYSYYTRCGLKNSKYVLIGCRDSTSTWIDMPSETQEFSELSQCISAYENRMFFIETYLKVTQNPSQNLITSDKTVDIISTTYRNIPQSLIYYYIIVRNYDDGKDRNIKDDCLTTEDCKSTIDLTNEAGKTIRYYVKLRLIDGTTVRSPTTGYYSFVVPKAPTPGVEYCIDENKISGICKDVTQVSTGGYFKQGLCSGTENIQCFFTDNTITSCETCASQDDKTWCTNNQKGYCTHKDSSCLSGYKEVFDSLSCSTTSAQPSQGTTTESPTEESPCMIGYCACEKLSNGAANFYVCENSKWKNTLSYNDFSTCNENCLTQCGAKCMTISSTSAGAQQGITTSTITKMDGYECTSSTTSYRVCNPTKESNIYYLYMCDGNKFNREGAGFAYYNTCKEYCKLYPFCFYKTPSEGEEEPSSAASGDITCTSTAEGWGGTCQVIDDNPINADRPGYYVRGECLSKPAANYQCYVRSPTITDKDTCLNHKIPKIWCQDPNFDNKGYCTPDRYDCITGYEEQTSTESGKETIKGNVNEPSTYYLCRYDEGKLFFCIEYPKEDNCDVVYKGSEAAYEWTLSSKEECKQKCDEYSTREGYAGYSCLDRQKTQEQKTEEEEGPQTCYKLNKPIEAFIDYNTKTQIPAGTILKFAGQVKLQNGEYIFGYETDSGKKIIMNFAQVISQMNDQDIVDCSRFRTTGTMDVSYASCESQYAGNEELIQECAQSRGAGSTGSWNDNEVYITSAPLRTLHVGDKGHNEMTAVIYYGENIKPTEYFESDYRCAKDKDLKYYIVSSLTKPMDALSAIIKGYTTYKKMTAESFPNQKSCAKSCMNNQEYCSEPLIDNKAVYLQNDKEIVIKNGENIGNVGNIKIKSYNRNDKTPTITDVNELGYDVNVYHTVKWRIGDQLYETPACTNNYCESREINTNSLPSGTVVQYWSQIGISDMYDNEITYVKEPENGVYSFTINKKLNNVEQASYERGANSIYADYTTTKIKCEDGSCKCCLGGEEKPDGNDFCEGKTEGTTCLYYESGKAAVCMIDGCQGNTEQLSSDDLLQFVSYSPSACGEQEYVLTYKDYDYCFYFDPSEYDDLTSCVSYCSKELRNTMKEAFGSIYGVGEINMIYDNILKRECALEMCKNFNTKKCQQGEAQCNCCSKEGGTTRGSCAQLLPYHGCGAKLESGGYSGMCVPGICDLY